MDKNGRLSLKIKTFRFGPGFTDKRSKKQLLSVNLSEILDRLVEQYCRLKKAVFSLKIKKDEQSQSQPDLLHSSFRLIQAENRTFSPASFLFAYF